MFLSFQHSWESKDKTPLGVGDKKVRRGSSAINVLCFEMDFFPGAVHQQNQVDARKNIQFMLCHTNFQGPLASKGVLGWKKYTHVLK